jgi:hypothetical protein
MSVYYVDGTRSDDTGNGLSEANAKKTPQAGLNLLANGDFLNIKASGVYSVSAALTCPAGPSYTAKTRIRGYTSSPGDGGKAIFRATAGVWIFDPGQPCSIEDLDVDGNSVASAKGVRIAQYGCVLNIKVRNCVTGIKPATDTHISWSEVTGCTAESIDGQSTNAVFFNDLWIHDNTGPLYAASSGAVIGCLITNNSGASNDGLNLPNGYDVLVRNCVIHGNGRHGIALPNNYANLQPGIQNNIITNNGGYGIFFNQSPVQPAQIPEFRNNAFRSNTSGNYNHSISGLGDIALTGDPFMNAAAGDFSLNNTAGAGAAARAAGYPGVFPGGLTTGYLDIGAAQHQDPAGGGGAGGPVGFRVHPASRSHRNQRRA